MNPGRLVSITDYFHLLTTNKEDIMKCFEFFSNAKHGDFSIVKKLEYIKKKNMMTKYDSKLKGENLLRS